MDTIRIEPYPPTSSQGMADNLSALKDHFADNVSIKGAVDNSPRERLVFGILAGLYDRRFQPGQRLIESQLTKEFGLSRGPIREVLNRLAAAGVVDLTLQSGARIRRLTPEEAVDIFVVSNSLVKLAACLAASRINAERAQTLQDALNHFFHCSRAMDRVQYALSRNNFFSTVLRLSGNTELYRVLPGFQTHLIRVQFGWALETADQHCAEDYRRIAKAIIAGKAAAAERACEAHFIRVISALKAASEVGPANE